MIIGLEISTDAVRAVRLGRPRVGAALQSVELPLENGRLPVAELAKLAGARKAVWGVAVPSSWCSYRTVTLPYNAPARVASTFRYALEGRLPGKLDDYCIDAISGPRSAGAGGCRLAVAACAREKLRDLMSQLKEGGIEPCIAQPAILVLARRMGSVAENALLLRVGQEAEMAVMQQGSLVAAEAIPLPQQDLTTSAGASALAERLRFALSAIALACGDLTPEKCILISAAPAGRSEGMSPLLRGELKDTLARALGIPVESAPTEIGDPAFAAACGIAVQASDNPHLAPSLLQDELAPRAHALRYERRAAIALAMAVGIVLLLCVHTARGILEARHSARSGGDREAKLYSQVFPGLRGTPDLAKMREARDMMEKEAGAGGVSAVARWAELRKLTPADIALESIDISPQQMTLRVRAKERGKVWDYQRALAKSGSLRPESPSDIKPVPDGFLFSMAVKYK